MIRTVYYVLLESTEKTIAICDEYQVASWLAENYPEKCVVRVSIQKMG